MIWIETADARWNADANYGVGMTMKYGRKLLLVLMVLLIGACNAKTPENVSGKAANPPVKPTDKEVPVMNNEAKKVAEVQPPSPSSVLYFIYQKDGDGALSYEVDNGSWATYWYGYRFGLDGKEYYTGFAYNTPSKYGKTEEENYAAPGAKATLTQSTFVLTAPGTESPWTFDGSDQYIGEFGGYEKGNEIDETRKPQSYRTPGGNLVLAIPTWYLATGTQVSSFDVFVFNPHELLKIDDQRWLYLGNVVTGTDNGAACDEEGGGKITCVKSSGALTFVPQQGSDLPLLRIARSGTEIASPGKTRVLGPTDTTEYKYDPAKKQYQ